MAAVHTALPSALSPRRAAAIALFGYVVLSPLLARNTVVLCPFRRLTGHACPFCGLTRSFAALLAGDLRRSVVLHPFGWAVIPAGLDLWIRPGRPARATPMRGAE